MVGYSEKSGNHPTNRYLDLPSHMTVPAVRMGTEITTADSADQNFTRAARALYIGFSGNLLIVNFDGTTSLMTGLVIGSIIDVQCIGTRASGSTVTTITPMY